MTRLYLAQSAILAGIVTILLSIPSGPMIKMFLSMEDYSNGLSVHKKLQNLNITTSSDFGGVKNTTELFFARLTNFLACVLGLSITLTILMIFRQYILYTTVVFLSLFTAAFIGLTILSVLLYMDLYNEHIDPYTKTSDLHGQMISSLKDNFRSDNLTTGTKISNEWNHLFIDFECCGVNKVVGTTNDFDQTPWCTTEGSCQATASQIPKTCCKGFTKYDYENAPTECHSSVSPGQFYDKGCFSVIMKEVIKEIDSFTNGILTEGLRLILVMGSCSFLSLIGLCVFIGLCATENGANRQTKNASTMTEDLYLDLQRNNHNYSTMTDHAQHLYPDLPRNNHNYSTMADHAQHLYQDFPRNNHNYSTMTEYADERIRHITPL